MAIDLAILSESRNHNSENIDTLSTFDMQSYNNEDKSAISRRKTLPEIVQLVDKVATAFLKVVVLFIVALVHQAIRI